MGFEPTDGFTRQTISSRSRYDLFDTAPYEIVGCKRPENQSAAKCRKSVEIIKHREERKREFPKSHGDFRSSAEKRPTRFRVVLVMTSSIPLRMKLGGTNDRKTDRLQSVEKVWKSSSIGKGGNANFPRATGISGVRLRKDQHDFESFSL